MIFIQFSLGMEKISRTIINFHNGCIHIYSIRPILHRK